jgi:glutamyl-Q tRNA(Asp) synthetase
MMADEPVLFQSQRLIAYQKSCEQLIAAGRAYWCGCSRKDLPPTGIYPGTCRNGLPPGKTPRALRIRVGNTPLPFTDRIHREQLDDLQSSVGDFVIKRADGMYAYQLAVVVDDALQQVTEVVRGTDLLDSTARQIWLQKCLGLPTPAYAHIPTALMPDGTKLSKSGHSSPISRYSPAKALRAALIFLGHEPPTGSLASTWEWALENWSIDKVGDAPTKVIDPVSLAVQQSV